MKPNLLLIGAVAVAGYILLKPKAAVAAPRGPMVTTTANPVNATVALISAVATPLVSWLTTSASHDVTEPTYNITANTGI